MSPGLSVIIDTHKRVAPPPVGLLPIVLMNENTIGFQTDSAPGVLTACRGKQASFNSALFNLADRHAQNMGLIPRLCVTDK
jgi:hypothetical protein